MVREAPAQPPPPKEPYPADKARGGSIVLRRRWQRWVFIGGLVGMAVLAIVLGLAGAA